MKNKHGGRCRNRLWAVPAEDEGCSPSSYQQQQLCALRKEKEIPFLDAVPPGAEPSLKQNTPSPPPSDIRPQLEAEPRCGTANCHRLQVQTADHCWGTRPQTHSCPPPSNKSDYKLSLSGTAHKWQEAERHKHLYYDSKMDFWLHNLKLNSALLVLIVLGYSGGGGLLTNIHWLVSNYLSLQNDGASNLELKFEGQKQRSGHGFMGATTLPQLVRWRPTVGHCGSPCVWKSLSHGSSKKSSSLTVQHCCCSSSLSWGWTSNHLDTVKLS